MIELQSLVHAPSHAITVQQMPPQVPFNTLKRHTERVHGPAKFYPPRTKETVPLTKFFSRKRQKVEESQKSSEVSDAASPGDTSDQNSWFAKFTSIFTLLSSLRFTQADTERVVKTIRKVEGRFEGFDEVKFNAGSRDRANQEMFLRENPVALSNLPLEKIYKTWRKKHQPSLKTQSKKNVSVSHFKKNDKSKAQFLE